MVVTAAQLHAVPFCSGLSLSRSLDLSGKDQVKVNDAD